MAILSEGSYDGGPGDVIVLLHGVENRFGIEDEVRFGIHINKGGVDEDVVLIPASLKNLSVNLQTEAEVKNLGARIEKGAESELSGLYTTGIWEKKGVECLEEMGMLSDDNSSRVRSLNWAFAMVEREEDETLVVEDMKKEMSSNNNNNNHDEDMEDKEEDSSSSSSDSDSGEDVQNVEKALADNPSDYETHVQGGRGEDGLELFEQLVKEQGMRPDNICLTAVLTACNHAGLVDRATEYFDKMGIEYDLIPELDQYACMVDLYGRTGQLTKAKKTMDEMPFEPNVVMLSSFLGLCRVYGEVQLGREAANQLFKMDPCSAAPYVTLANIYAEAEFKDTEIERYSDRGKPNSRSKRDSLASHLRLTPANFPLELVQGSRRAHDPRKVRWNPESGGLQKLDFLEKLDEKIEKKKEGEDEDNEEEPELEDAEFSDDGDYNQNVDFDDDEDDFNMGDANEDEATF
ncbi:hypothetical protein IFM89_030725 [Coptis chinensis]|uniref:Pentatricopeptide repeat-containing protein n=1 Tax=Coptis chinensis TaxID=261450 RepID=A0A835J179_9MAGN|nr:hypothetical protein IFM89_030725 [Coptis chinensis]